MSGGLGARPRTSVRVPSGQIHFAQRVFNHEGSPENLFSGETKKVTLLSDFLKCRHYLSSQAVAS